MKRMQLNFDEQSKMGKLTALFIVFLLQCNMKEYKM